MDSAPVDCLASFGSAAGVDLLPDGFTSTTAGLSYSHSPILIVTAANLLRAVDALAAITDKPVLVHDDIGSRAAIVVLLRAAQEMKEASGAVVTIAQFNEWCSGLGVPVAQVWLPEVTKALKSL